MTDVVNIGAADNDDAGDPLRAAFNKINIEFARLGITLQHVPLTSLPVASFIGPNDPHASMVAGYVPDTDQKVATKGYADAAITAAANALQPIAEKGVASGYTPLDATNHVPVIHLPSALAVPRKVFDNVVDMLAGTKGIHAGDGLLVTDDPVNAKNGEYVARVNHPTTMAQLWFLGDRVPVHRHGSPEIDTFLAGRVMTLDVAMRELLVTSGNVMMDGGYEPTMDQAIATKKYVDSVSGSIPAWVDSAHHTHALVSAHGCIYMATEAIVAGDLAPDVFPGSGTSQKWMRIAGTRITVGGEADKPAFVRDGDRHFMEGATEPYPREVIFYGGAWHSKAISVEIKARSREFGAFDQTIGLEIGTPSDPNQILWLRGMEHGNTNWHKVDKLWNTAWGYIAGGRLPQNPIASLPSEPGRFTFDAVKGRQYKINVNIPVGCGNLGDRTKIHAHIHYDGDWLDEGEDGAAWESATGYKDNQVLAHLSAQAVVPCLANKPGTVVYIDIQSTVADTIQFAGRISVEDIGPY